MGFLWRALAHLLWIAGLACILAGLSWARWMAGVAGSGVRQALACRPARPLIDVGFGLGCAGLAATGRFWWEWVLWGALGVWWGVRVARREGWAKGDQ